MADVKKEKGQNDISIDVNDITGDDKIVLEGDKNKSPSRPTSSNYAKKTLDRSRKAREQNRNKKKSEEDDGDSNSEKEENSKKEDDSKRSKNQNKSDESKKADEMFKDKPNGQDVPKKDAPTKKPGVEGGGTGKNGLGTSKQIDAAGGNPALKGNMKNPMSKAGGTQEGITSGVKNGLNKAGTAAKDATKKAAEQAGKAIAEAIKKAAAAAVKAIAAHPVAWIVIGVVILILVIAILLNMLINDDAANKDLDATIENVKTMQAAVNSGELAGDPNQVNDAMSLNSDFGSYLGFTMDQLDYLYKIATDTTDIDKRSTRYSLISLYKTKYGLGDKLGLSNATGLSYVNWALEIAEDDSHGYSQSNRLGNPDYDCSSLVYYSLKQAGYSEEELGGSWPFTTYTMGNILKSLGFEEIPFTGVDNLEVGDILVVNSSQANHTEIYVGEGKTVGAHCDENGGIAGTQSGDQGAPGGYGEISVINAASYWQYAYRPSNSSLKSSAFSGGGVLKETQYRSLYKHILYTEKYNFNAIKWKNYSHNQDGARDLKDSEMAIDKDMGVTYPKDNKMTYKKFMSLTQPYLLSNYVPLSFLVSEVTKSQSTEFKNGIKSNDDILDSLGISTSSEFYNEDSLAYQIILNGLSDVEVSQYTLQKRHLNTHYLDYDEQKYHDMFIVTETQHTDPATGQVTITRSNVSEVSSIKDGDVVHKNSRWDGSKNEDPKLESVDSDIISSENVYYVTKAIAFDTTKISEYTHQKYNDSDVANRTNADSEGVIDSVYNETINEGNQITGSVSVANIGNYTETQRYQISGGDANTKIYRVTYRGGDYYKRNGTRYDITRKWEDKATPKKSETKTFNVDKVSDFNKKISGISSDVLSLDGLSDEELSWASNWSASYIGDSLGVGVSGYLNDLFPKMNTDVMGSRAFEYPYGNTIPGITALRTMISNGTLKENLVVALGTNNDVTSTNGATIQHFLDAVPSSVKTITFIGTASEGGVNYTAINDQIKKIGSSDSRVNYIDWRAFVEANGGWAKYAAGDGIHMSAEGYATYARYHVKYLYHLYGEEQESDDGKNEDGDDEEQKVRGIGEFNESDFKKSDDYEYYKGLAEEKKLNIVDLIDSANSIFQHYVSIGNSRSDYIGLGRDNIGIKTTYDIIIKKYFDNIADNNKIKFIWGTSLGYEVSSGDSSGSGNYGTAFQLMIRLLHEFEGGGTVYQNAEGVDCYKVLNVIGDMTVGYGVDITVNPQWKARLEEQMGSSITFGTLVPCEYVDAIEEEFLTGVLESIDAVTSENGVELKEYQKHALAIRKYNTGNIVGFVNAYKSYYKEDVDDRYEKTYEQYGSEPENVSAIISCADLSSQLFNNYLSTPVTAAGAGVLQGLVTRRREEYYLFSLGYYTHNNFHAFYTEGASFNGINTINADGSINLDKCFELQVALEDEIFEGRLHTGAPTMSSPWGQMMRPNTSANTDDHGNLSSKYASIFAKSYYYQCPWWSRGRANVYLNSIDSNKFSGAFIRDGLGNGIDLASGIANAYGVPLYTDISQLTANCIISYSGGGYGHTGYVEAVGNDYYVLSQCGSGTYWHGIAVVPKTAGGLPGNPFVGFVKMDDIVAKYGK